MRPLAAVSVSLSCLSPPVWFSSRWEPLPSCGTPAAAADMRDGLRRELQMRAEGDRVLQDVEHLPVDKIRALAQQQPRYRRGWEATAALDADNPPIPPRLSQQSPRGNTGLMEAARRNDPSLVDALLGQGEDVNARDESGVTALHIAAGKFWNDGVILSKLIAAGADVNAQDDHGATPLMYASGKGEVLAVKLLVEAGADGSIRAEDGKTARERIPSSENEELLALLRRAEGRH